MNERYDRQVSAGETDDLAELERQKRIARRKRQQRRRRNRRLRIGALLLLLLIAIALLVFALIPMDTQSLKGTWAYGEAATLRFNGNGSGTIALSDTNTECAFSYTVEENTLEISFDNAYITNATYTFTVERDTLTLLGGEGTTGGTYVLQRTKA